jgi:UPF0755 protein
MMIAGIRIANRRLIACVIAATIVIPAGLMLKAARLPAGDGKRDIIVTFRPGLPLRKVAAELAAKKVLASPRLFAFYGRLRGEANRIQAGTYRFNDAMTGGEILRKLVAGDVYVRPFVLPPGYSMYQAAELLEQQGYFSREAFLRECRNREVLRSLGIEGESAEGYLYPATYNVADGMNEAALLREMVAEFQKRCRSRFETRVRNSGMTWGEVLTLASMIEKEAVRPEERERISSVFHNRLKLKMRLQSDPTSVYGVRAFGGKVSGGDVRRRSRYNTYVVDGLPPGPIGNPGEEAIEAALSPLSTPFLYFVARNDGTHHFSETLKEHNRAVTKYLKSPEAAGARDELQNTAGRR